MPSVVHDRFDRDPVLDRLRVVGLDVPHQETGDQYDLYRHVGCSDGVGRTQNGPGFAGAVRYRER